MLFISQSDLICKSLAVCDSKGAPETGKGQATIPFGSFLPPFWHLRYRTRCERWLLRPHMQIPVGAANPLQLPIKGLPPDQGIGL